MIDESGNKGGGSGREMLMQKRQTISDRMHGAARAKEEDKVRINIIYCYCYCCFALVLLLIFI